MEIEIRSKGLTGSGPSQRGCDLCARTGPPVFRGLQIYTQHYYYPSNLFGLWKKSDLFGLWDAWPGVSQPGAALEQLRLMPSSSDRSLKKNPAISSLEIRKKKKQWSIESSRQAKRRGVSSSGRLGFLRSSFLSLLRFRNLLSSNSVPISNAVGPFQDSGG